MAPFHLSNASVTLAQFLNLLSVMTVYCYYFLWDWSIIILTLWTPEDGIPTFRKCPNAAKLRYTVQTASYKSRRPTVYHRYGS